MQFIINSSPTGDFDFTVNPDPVHTLFSRIDRNFCQGYSNNLLIAVGDPCTLPHTGGVVTGSNFRAGGAVGDNFLLSGAMTAVQLSDYFSSYRVVGMGCKFQSLVPATSATGRLLFCTTPSPIHAVPYDLTLLGAERGSDNVVTGSGYSRFMNIPPCDASGYLNTEILALPTGHEITTNQMISTGGIFTSKICSPECYSWRALNKNAAIGTTSAGPLFVDSEGFSGFGFASGTPMLSDLKEPVSTAANSISRQKITNQGNHLTGSWTQLHVRGVNFKPCDTKNVVGSTPVVPQVLTDYVPLTAQLPTILLEVVFHLEGTENMIGASGSFSGFASEGTVPPVSMNALHAVQSMASSRPDVIGGSSGSNYSAMHAVGR